MARRSPQLLWQNELHRKLCFATGRPLLLRGTSVRKPLLPQRKTGDPRALPTGVILSTLFARSLASVINILDPQVIVLGGGLSNVSQIHRDLPAAIVPWIFLRQLP